MKTKKSLKFSKETVIVLNHKSKQTIMGGQQAEINNLVATSKHIQCLV
ncbi:hypothetical protein ACFONJ_14945 [Chryseobacterium tructae]|uniref:Bacteriocin n=1 Tax=Chryseobacterium tructae TaxID=1037380 RepID=A0ABV7XXQ9_9FLAO